MKNILKVFSPKMNGNLCVAVANCPCSVSGLSDNPQIVNTWTNSTSWSNTGYHWNNSTSWSNTGYHWNNATSWSNTGYHWNNSTSWSNTGGNPGK